MTFLRDMIDKFKQKSEKEKELEEDIRIQTRVQEKQKSADERELERYMKENRDRQIKHKLEGLRQRQSNELWKANLLRGKSVRRGIHNNILNERKRFLGGNIRWA